MHGIIRAGTDPTREEKLTDEARELGRDVSPGEEAATAEASRLERNRLWRKENRAAITVYAEDVLREGFALVRLIGSDGTVPGPGTKGDSRWL